MKKFNISTICVPDKHYMVDISKKVNSIIKLIDDGDYFVINRARQYGKTTTLAQVEKLLKKKYVVISISFEDISDIESKQEFINYFVSLIKPIFKEQNLESSGFDQNIISDFSKLSRELRDIMKTSKREFVLIIDEIDKAADNKYVIDFLGMLRKKYINASIDKDITFKSVILAGIRDIKNLKAGIKQGNETVFAISPWNVAVDFKVDMSFNPDEISTMLVDYEKETSSKINIEEASNEIYNYTSGYPFLVSKLCKVIDEELSGQFTVENINIAVNIIIKEKNTLFDDIIKNLQNDEELFRVINKLLIDGVKLSFDIYTFETGVMYGLLREDEEGKVVIHNKIFEAKLYSFLSQKKLLEDNSIADYSLWKYTSQDGSLNMDFILEKFQELMLQEYRQKDIKFYESQARLIFLAFIKPIINGSGFYFVEPQTRQNRRFDVVIVYKGKRYIVELKLWRGEAYENKGINQLVEYVKISKENKGWLISFDFRSKKLEYKSKSLVVDGINIFEIVL